MKKCISIFLMISILLLSQGSISFGENKVEIDKLIKISISDITKVRAQYSTIKSKYYSKYNYEKKTYLAKIDELSLKISSGNEKAENEIYKNGLKISELTNKFKRSNSLTQKELFKAMIDDLQMQNGEINLSLIEDVAIFFNLITSFKMLIQKIENIFYTSDEIFMKFKTDLKDNYNTVSKIDYKIKNYSGFLTMAEIASLKISKQKILSRIISYYETMMNTFAIHLDRIESIVLY